MGKRIFTCVTKERQKKKIVIIIIMIIFMIIIMIINTISYKGIKRLKDPFKKSF